MKGNVLLPTTRSDALPCFDRIFEARNRGLFLLGVNTGGRISELLNR